VADTSLDVILSRFKSILESEVQPTRTERFTRYAITNFRGGIGKSTLAFNLAWEMSRSNRVLLLDLCSQRNFSQTLIGEALTDRKITIYDALLAEILGGEAISPTELVEAVKPYCPSFKGGEEAFVIPGSSELFLFPSLLYSQLATHAQVGSRGRVLSAKALDAVNSIITQVSPIVRPDKVLIDTSPFFGGATHLGWMAAEALIIPVRVDQHSMDALKLTLQMLRDKTMDFIRFNDQAGIQRTPKVHAVAITHCGWNRQTKNSPDNSTKYFVSQAMEIAKKYSEFFTEESVVDCFYLLDDFHASGRISGTRRIPIFNLEAGQQYTVDAQKLEVNPAVDRYKKELHALASAL